MPRLHRVECSGPGYTRRRAGRGWVYLDHEGNPLRDEEALERIRALVIPPAWTDVWICPDPYGHLQAVGTDAAGRRQYLYHPQWRTRRDSKKFDEMLAFAERLPDMRRHIWKLLKQDGLARDRVLAAAVAFLDRGLFRVGGEEYADEHGGYGLATLERRHVELVGSRTVSFDFVGKAGKRQLLRVNDRWLYRGVGGAEAGPRPRHGLPRLRERQWLARRQAERYQRVHQGGVGPTSPPRLPHVARHRPRIGRARRARAAAERDRAEARDRGHG